MSLLSSLLQPLCSCFTFYPMQLIADEVDTNLTSTVLIKSYLDVILCLISSHKILTNKRMSVLMYLFCRAVLKRYAFLS